MRICVCVCVSLYVKYGRIVETESERDDIDEWFIFSRIVLVSMKVFLFSLQFTTHLKRDLG